jgi:hypothetical protein
VFSCCSVRDTSGESREWPSRPRYRPLNPCSDQQSSRSEGRLLLGPAKTTLGFDCLGGLGYVFRQSPVHHTPSPRLIPRVARSGDDTTMSLCKGSGVGGNQLYRMASPRQRAGHALRQASWPVPPERVAFFWILRYHVPTWQPQQDSAEGM